MVDGTTVLLVVVLLFVLLVVVSVVKAVQIIPQAQAAVVERLGRYQRTLTPGLAFLVPFIDRIRARIDLREQVVSFPPQPVITQDNLTVNIDTVVYYQVLNAQAAVYEISDYITGVEQITITTLRNVVGGMSLEGTLTSRDEINDKLRGELDKATGSWGIRVGRVEIKAIDPPPSIQESMERQMKADREKRAHDPHRRGPAGVGDPQRGGAEAGPDPHRGGRKQAAILDAEAERQSRILRAQGERAAQYLQPRARPRRSRRCSPRSRRAPTPELLAYQYLQTLPEMAKGEANKVWMVPSDFGKALEGFTRCWAPGEDGVFRFEPSPVDDVPAAGRRTTTSRCATGSTPRRTRRSRGSSRTPRRRRAGRCAAGCRPAGPHRAVPPAVSRPSPPPTAAPQGPSGRRAPRRSGAAPPPVRNGRRPPSPMPGDGPDAARTGWDGRPPGYPPPARG
jgi:regulator of protease activity HflC (stomatin/prohibitin superfamily)